jgi:hypothetical protein
MLLECHWTCFSHSSITLLSVLLYPLLQQSHCPKLKEPSCLLVKEPTIDCPFVINMHMYKILMCTSLYPCKASSLRSSTTSLSQKFQILTLYMTPRHVCEGWSIFQSGTILIKYQLRVKEWGKYWKVLGDRYMFSDGQFYPTCILFPGKEFECRWFPFV